MLFVRETFGEYRTLTLKLTIMHYREYSLEDYDSLPEEVQNIIGYEVDPTYEKLAEMRLQLHAIGWDMDYYLNAEITSIGKMSPELTRITLEINKESEHLEKYPMDQAIKARLQMLQKQREKLLNPDKVIEDPKVYSFAEALSDIAYTAGSHKFYSGDSRQDIALFIQWAQEFVLLYQDETYWNDHDYVETIHDFAIMKIKYFIKDNPEAEAEVKEKMFLIKDNSGRGGNNQISLSDLKKYYHNEPEEPDDQEQTLYEWAEDAEPGEEWDLSSEATTITAL